MGFTKSGSDYLYISQKINPEILGFVVRGKDLSHMTWNQVWLRSEMLLKKNFWKICIEFEKCTSKNWNLYILNMS